MCKSKIKKMHFLRVDRPLMCFAKLTYYTLTKPYIASNHLRIFRSLFVPETGNKEKVM